MTITGSNDAAVRTIATGGSYRDEALTPDGASLLVSNADGSVTRYDVASGAATGQWQVGKQLGGMSVSPDGRYLWAGDLEPVSRTPNPNGGETTVCVVHRLDLATGAVTDFTRTNSGFYDSTILFDVVALGDGTVVASQSNPYSGGNSPLLLRLDPASGTFAEIAGTAASQPSVLSGAADGVHVLVGSTNASDAPLFEYTNGQGVTARHDSYQDNVFGFNHGAQAVRRDGSGYAQALDSTVNLYDGDLHLSKAVSLTVGDPFGSTSTRIGAVAYSPDGTYLYALSDGTNAVYRIVVATGAVDAVIAVDAGAADGEVGYAPNFGDRLSISADGRVLSVQGSGGVQVIDTAAIVSGPTLSSFGVDYYALVTENGGSAGYSFAASSSVSTVASVTVSFDAPLATTEGFRSAITFDNPDASATFSSTGLIALTDEAGGTHRVISVTVTDDAGHSTTYSTDDGFSYIPFQVRAVITLTDGDDIYDHSDRQGEVTIIGSSGNDTISGGLANDYLDGGAGVDVARYRGAYRDYHIDVGRHYYFEGLGGYLSRVDGVISGADAGIDTINAVETFDFEDSVLSFDPDGIAAQIEGLYETAFSRRADAGGFNDFNQAVAAGATVRDVAERVVASAEFQGYQGHLGNADYVETLYRTALYRPSDAGGKAYWTGELDSGRMDRADVLLGFSRSAERLGFGSYASDGGLFFVKADAEAVAELYDAAFGRLADRGGFDFWLGTLRGGSTTLGSVADGFAASSEFQGRTVGTDNGAFVDYLYATALDRAADAGGRAGWVGMLDAGTSRGQVLLAFAQSAEHTLLNAANVDHGIVLG